ncbi:SH3 domain-containing protein [Phototrophicus methaneseepsis]|uniref:SH3 domain-containing protein n=1 Tax=Phototrophicus methaneseepsis TaxID=2710758 RepID=A0A7S8ED73_9CHLR|nr:SH3 domain-containing protein [Phototrophicus methaneseepsis]QPC84776.1 SH3 domain-containing protein [Phototrophicus methaneseepsis]
MRRPLGILTLLLVIVGFASVQAQTPQSCVLTTTTDQGRIAAIFAEETSITVPPDNIVINCDSDPLALTMITRATSPALNTLLPIPQHETGMAESQPGYAIVNTPFANLRSGPGPVNTRVAVVRGGTRLVILGQNASQTWWYVQVGDVRGWIWNDLLILRGDLTNIPLIETQAEITPPTLYVGFTGNPIYAALTTDAEVICPIMGNLEYKILGRNPSSSYYYIEATCLDGTIAAGWLQSQAGIIRNPASMTINIMSGS